MKPILLLCAATIIFTSCDEQKAEKAKADTAAAAKSVGELAQDTASKGMVKAKDAAKAVGEKIKAVTGGVVAKTSPALEAFKSKLSGFSETMKTMQGQAGDNPAKARELMSTLMTRLSSISADGIPADFAEAFRNYQAVMLRTAEITRTIPSDTKAQEKWQMDHSVELQKLEADSQKALKDLKDSAARHGLTGLDLGGGSEEPRTR